MYQVNNNKINIDDYTLYPNSSFSDSDLDAIAESLFASCPEYNSNTSDNTINATASNYLFDFNSADNKTNDTLSTPLFDFNAAYNKTSDTASNSLYDFNIAESVASTFSYSAPTTDSLIANAASVNWGGITNTLETLADMNYQSNKSSLLDYYCSSEYFEANKSSLINYMNPFTSTNSISSTPYYSSGTSNNDVVNTAAQYIGETDYTIFSNYSNAWCADFATYAVKQAYQRSGKNLPAGFGSSSVLGLQNWGKSNGSYVETSTMNANQRAQYIANNVKPGDIIIFKRNGRSHTGIVESVESNGTIHTIEGNTWGTDAQSGKSSSTSQVMRKTYPPSSETLSGFVQLSKLG